MPPVVKVVLNMLESCPRMSSIGVRTWYKLMDTTFKLIMWPQLIFDKKLKNAIRFCIKSAKTDLMQKIKIDEQRFQYVCRISKTKMIWPLYKDKSFFFFPMFHFSQNWRIFKCWEPNYPKGIWGDALAESDSQQDTVQGSSLSGIKWCQPFIPC